jgi:Caspase domain
MMSDQAHREIIPISSVAGAEIVRGRCHVATIGIDDYKHFRKLNNAVSDARGFAKVLTEKFGFLEQYGSLINGDATRSAILDLIEDRLRTTLEPNDELVLFFAGHGHTRVDTVGGKPVETGFLVPVEARAETPMKWVDLIEINGLLESIGSLPARHILVILDACYSGFALGSALQAPRSMSRYEADLAGRTSRKVITSAHRDQLAIDTGPVAGHSLFTGTLIDGLNWGHADLDGNSLVTSTELGLYAQQQVAKASISGQTPDFGSFRYDDRGELFLSLRNESFDALKTRALAALQDGELTTFRQFAQRVGDLRPTSPESLYLKYRAALLANDLWASQAAIGELLRIAPAEGTIPLSRYEVEKIAYQLPFWEPILAVPEGDFPIGIEPLVLESHEESSLQAGPSETGAGPGMDQVAQLVKIGELEALWLMESQNLRFRAINELNTTWHIYMFEIDPEGRLVLSPLWPGQELWQGVQPGKQAVSYPFRQTGMFGISEIRLLASTEPVSVLISAPDVGTRSLLARSSFSDALRRQAASIKMKRVRYKMVRGQAAPPASATDRRAGAPGDVNPLEGSGAERSQPDLTSAPASKSPVVTVRRRVGIRPELAEQVNARRSRYLEIVKPDDDREYEVILEWGSFVVRDHLGQPLERMGSPLKVGASDAIPRLVQRLEHVIRYRNAWELRNPDPASALQHAIDIIAVRTRGQDRVEIQTGLEALHPGDKLTLYVVNRSGRALFATLLYFAPDWRIQPLWPDYPRPLEPTEPGGYEVLTGPIDLPEGVSRSSERFKVIATERPASSKIEDFSFPAIERDEDASHPRDRSWESVGVTPTDSFANIMDQLSESLAGGFSKELERFRRETGDWTAVELPLETRA